MSVLLTSWIDPIMHRNRIARLQTMQAQHQAPRNQRRLSDWQFRRAQVAHAHRLPPEACLAALLVEPSDCPIATGPDQAHGWRIVSTAIALAALTVLAMNLIML